MPPVNEWLVALIIAVMPVLTQVVLYLFGLVSIKIPSWIKPILATALGFLALYLEGLAVSNPVLAALAAGAAVMLRQIVVKLGEALGYRDKETGKWFQG